MKSEDVEPPSGRRIGRLQPTTAFIDLRSLSSLQERTGGVWKTTIVGNPATKKTSNRIFRVRGRIVVAPSAANAIWARSAIPQLKTCWNRPPLTLPVQVAARFFRRDNRRVDLVNLMQAVADALEHAGVVVNDRLIVSWDGSRLSKDAVRPRVELEVELFNEAARPSTAVARSP